MSRRSPLVLALLALAAGSAACSEEAPFESPDKEICLARDDGQRYCIETYEASRKDATGTQLGADIDSPSRSLPGRVPWTDVPWAAAKAACEAKNKRLCDRDEWIDACDGTPGAGGTKYAYGEDLDASRCNVGGTGVAPTGSFPSCHGATGPLDLSGNVWEWTGNIAATAATRGGGPRSDIVHECKSGDGVQLFQPDTPSPEVGFRCCRSL